MLSAIQHSTNTILSSVSDSDDAVMYGENREQAVKRMVNAAFKNCDITRTGKLLPLVSQPSGRLGLIAAWLQLGICVYYNSGTVMALTGSDGHNVG